jgi:hypothetical protein
MRFKVKIDLADAYDVLNMLGMGDIAKKPYWINIDADDPDDACKKSRDKVATTIENTFKILEVSEGRIKDAVNGTKRRMKIIKIVSG